MSTFVFKAMDVAGAPMRGQVDADSKQAVSDQLKARGLIVLDIAEKHRSRDINITVFERIKLTDLSIFSRQLATMVSSGMTILRALFVRSAGAGPSTCIACHSTRNSRTVAAGACGACALCHGPAWRRRMAYGAGSVRGSRLAVSASRLAVGGSRRAQRRRPCDLIAG